MPVWPLLLVLAAPSARAAGSRPAKEAAAPAVAKSLHEGRWRLAVGGVLCNACTKAVVEAVQDIPGVTKASFDYEDGALELSVARTAQVRVPLIERALRLAGRRVDLDTRFTLTETKYLGPAAEPEKPAAPAPMKVPKAAPKKPELPPASFPEPTPD